MIRVIAVDVDGTLLDSRARLPDAHRDALVEAVRCGAEVALVTGRSFHFAKPIADLLPIPLTLIVNNGALLKTRSGDTVMRHLLTRDAARQVLDATRAYENSVALVFDRPGERQIVFERMDWSHPNRRAYYDTNKAFIAQETPLSRALTEEPVQLMFNGSLGPMRVLVTALRRLPIADHLSVSITEYERRDFALVDVNGPGCSKGATLARWAASRGWTRDEVAAVGDNLNDVEMLDFAGTAFVMGNATPELQSRYSVVPSNDEDGLAVAVSRLSLRSDS